MTVTASFPVPGVSPGAGVWVQTRFHLEPDLGQRIRLRWIAETWNFGPGFDTYYEFGGTWSNTTHDEGWWLDDIQLTGAVQVAAGARSACAVLVSGTARCWGLNVFGQLGDGSRNVREAPVDVLGLTSAVHVTVSRATLQAHACATRADGAVFCWGNNQHGEVGNGTHGLRPELAPARVEF